MTSHAPPAEKRLKINAWPIVALLAAVAAAVLLPTQALRMADLVGYAVCHRIPDRSFFVQGIQLPLCARDTGMFSAALLGLLSFAVIRPERVALFPRRPHLYALAAFAAAWALDGFNSYMLLARGEPLLYMPQNWLRLVTGAFMGAAVSSFVVPLFNSAVWRPDLSASRPSVASWREVALLAGVALAVIAVVLWRPDFLYGPIALVSVLGVLLLLTVVNALLVLLLMKKESRIQRWTEMALPLMAGLMFTFTEIMAIALLRAWLTQELGLPF